jgi:glycosyltransferase involved in cell wall biosynthesis
MTYNKDIKFIIITPTYNRLNKKTPSYLERSINSILNQTYTNWDLIVVGDKYEPEEELLTILENFRKKLVNNNKIIYLKNTKPEREIIKTKFKLWNIAGGNAVNMALDYARNNNYKYYCHLDDDDCWLNNHLEELYKIYSKFDNCIFCNTQSQHLNGYLPRYNNIQIFPNNRMPLSCQTVHSSYSFRLDIIKFNYFTTNKEEDIKYPTDAIMLDKIKDFIIINSQYCSIYNPILTCCHPEEGQSFR